MDLAKKSTSDIDEKYELISTSDIDKKLDNIKSSFDEEYEKWSSGKQSESSSKHGNQSRDGGSPTTLNSSSSISKKGRPEANCVETSSELPEHTIHGFVNEKLFLMNFLLKQKDSEEFKTVAIVGKYGVGKTTLCQDVFNDKDVKGTYLPRIWVSMYSKETKEDEDPKTAVVKRILRSLGYEEEMLKNVQKEAEEEKEKVMSRLLSFLHLNLIGKKYLIVLDDVWEDNEWNQRLSEEMNQQDKSHISCGFPKGFGGRVIVTTRDERLAKKIVGEEENLLRLFPRTDTETVWNIYIDAVPKKDGEAEDANAGDAEAANAGDTEAANAGDTEAANAGDTEAANAGNVIVPDGGNGEAKKMKVNPRYPGRFKKELMDKSCGIPLAARMLATIEPVSNETKRGVDRKKSF